MKILKSVFLSSAGLRWGWKLLLYFIIVIGCIALFVAPVIWILSIVDLSPQPGKAVNGWASVAGSIITLLTGYTAFLIGTHVAQRLLCKSNLLDLGLFISKGWYRDVSLGIALGSLIVIVSIFLSWIMGWYQFIGFSWQFRPVELVLPAILLSLIVSMQSPILEEVFFRGFLFQTLNNRFNLRTTIFISSGLFGLAHLTSVGSDFSGIAAVISTFLAGLMFAQAYLVHHNLWLPMGIHFGWIFTGRLLNDVGGPVEKALLLVSKVEGPSLLVNPSGAGVGLLELIGVGVVSLLLWQMTNRRQINS